jgi:hypothetical protein
LSKRRRKPVRATPAERRKAQKTISQAFKKIGAEARGRKARVGTRVRAEMSKVIRKEFLSETGERLTARESKDLAKRFSLAGVAKRQAARERSYYVDAKGRFRDNRPGKGGKFISQASARRRDSLLAYWRTVKMIAKAQGVSVSEARRAYTLTGAEPWKEVAPGRTP